MGQRFLTVRVYGEGGASGQACPADLFSRTSLLPACCMLCEPRHLLFTYLDERNGGAVVNCCICLNILFLVSCVCGCVDGGRFRLSLHCSCTSPIFFFFFLFHPKTLFPAGASHPFCYPPPFPLLQQEANM